MKDKLRWIHRWLGIPLGIMFFVTLASGAYISYTTYLLNTGNHGQTYRVTTVQEDAAAIEFINNEFGAVTSITFPAKSAPYYQAIGRGSRAFVSIGEHEVIRPMSRNHGPVYTWLFQLHRYYRLRTSDNIFGISGDHIVAWMSLTAVVISLLGVYLWWPFRSKYKIQQAVPMSNKRRAYFNAHLTSGLIVVGAIVILGLTGASIQYRAFTSDFLNANQRQQPEVGLLERPERLGSDMAGWLEAAKAKFPDGRMVQIEYPRGGTPGGQVGGQVGGQAGAQGAMGGFTGGQAMGGAGGGAQARGQGMGNAGGQAMGNAGAQAMGRQAMGGGAMGGGGGGGAQGVLGQALSVRFVTKSDWLSVPNSYVYINQTDNTLVGVKSFSQNRFGQKLFAMLNPLHTGNNISPLYAIVMALMVTLAAIMIFSGLVSMIWNLLKKKRPKGSLVVVSKGEGDKEARVTIEMPDSDLGGDIKGAPAE